MKGFKHQLPTKVCQTCQQPFQWRRKWALNWDQVLYCSDRCRQQKRKPQ